ncbi:polyketide synthase dehydratase domain-containing protein (plasmid) [Streptomyces sp. CA-100214]
MVDLPGDAGHGGVVGGGRLSLERHPWLAEHVVHGTHLVPATVPAELAAWAAHRAGFDAVDELTLETPLVLSRTAEREIRVVLDGTGTVGVHSRGDGETRWTRNAVGRAGGAPAQDGLGAWPPPGATRVPFEEEYARLADLGFDHGPHFRGLKTLWSRGDTLFAEVEPPRPVAPDRTGSGSTPRCCTRRCSPPSWALSAAPAGPAAGCRTAPPASGSAPSGRAPCASGSNRPARTRCR